MAIIFYPSTKDYFEITITIIKICYQAHYSFRFKTLAQPEMLSSTSIILLYIYLLYIHYH